MTLFLLLEVELFQLLDNIDDRLSQPGIESIAHRLKRDHYAGIARFWGEVLVSVEYGELWRRMATTLDKDESVFYYPHYVHDAKVHPLSTVSPLATTHSDHLGVPPLLQQAERSSLTR